MSYTKGEIVQEALTELGIADYDFDVIPEQFQRDIRRLDAMMGVWTTKGIGLFYPLSSGPNDSCPSDESYVPDYALEAVITNLAIRLAPSYGKVVSMDTKTAAKDGYTALLQRFAVAPQMQYQQMPRGAGSKNYDYPFTSAPTDDQLERVDESVTLGEPEDV
jgi:hypothetical protein